ncbi:MAG: dipeptidyl aminopeptidase/acylaminoacyl peptidase [Rhodothermales bacterium]|jgi:dipeptidyl aminopeptidase/acylaminoacyl peptidase
MASPQFVRLALPLALLIAVTSPAFAQKKDLTLEDYAQWERIGSNTLSPDGTWFAYQIVPVEGDGSLRVKRVGSDDEHVFELGASPRFSNDNTWLAFAIEVSEAEKAKLEKSKKRAERSLGLMNLGTAEVDTIEHVQSAEFSDDGQFIALRKYTLEGSDAKGSDLVIRNLAVGSHQNVGNVSGFEFSPQGSMLAVTINASEKLGNGVQLLDLSASTLKVLESAEKTFSDLEWRDDSFDLAYLKEGESQGEDYPDQLVVVHFGLDTGGRMQTFDAGNHPDFPAEYRVASEGGVSFAEDGSRVFFGLKERVSDEEDDEPEEEEATEPKDDEVEIEDADESESETTNADRDKDLDPPGVDVWHWKDPVVQPRQGVLAGRDKNYTYLSSWTFSDDAFAKLADDNIRSISLTGNQHHGVGYDLTPYQPALRETWNDVYVVDTHTGVRERVLERIENVVTSPDGYFVLYFRGDDWWSYSVAEREHRNLTEDLDAQFNNFTAIYGREEDRAFGRGQWTEGDATVLLYDQYDVYRVNADGSGSKRLTFGAADQVRFRQARVDFENDALGANEPVYFSAYGDRTKDSGYYVLRVAPGRSEDEATLDQLMYEPRSVSRLTRAKDAEVFTVITQKADESPNIYAFDASFDSPIQLTDTNQQQADYKWGHTELVDFTNQNGVPLQGRLLYPADYEPGKKYPMVVYIYELRSQSLHSYTLPTRTSAYNQRRFSAEGYFVYEPDIVYRLRDPGMSAVEALVPAVAAVVETGMIDEERIGLTGHSWGAYQTSFVVTQTDIFSAAVAGAPLTNMISMYNSVYWNSGGTDATIFEISQGRFPKPYWEDMEKFIQNSPVFNATEINTPLLVAFGDEDGAVDFNQGVELYNTMRRLEKEFVLLVYDGENHGLRQRQNQMDYANRTHDWFNHFLRDREPAAWIKDGIPFLEKELERKKAEEAREKAAGEG